jgi:predicted O-methyltransferase YrrM
MSYDPDSVVTAWRGHQQFAWWLVQQMDPVHIVELGVDYGFSLLELARYNKGYTTGIDWFQGDAQTGARNTESIARKNLSDSGFDRVEIVNAKFDDAQLNFLEAIDILHIDGAHDYSSVKHDFETWLPRVRPGGVILLHDTQSFPKDVGRFFHEIEMPKFEFTHSAGLGVITKPR